MCPRCSVFDSFLAEPTHQQATAALSQGYRPMGVGQGLMPYQCPWQLWTVGEGGIITQSRTETKPMRGNNGLGVKSICEVGPALAGAQSNMPLCWRGTAMGTGTRDIEVVVGGLLHTACFNDTGKGGCSLYEKHLPFFQHHDAGLWPEGADQINFNTNPSTIAAR